MFSFDKRISLLETHMVNHTKREEEEMHITNRQLEEINATLVGLSKTLIHQDSKIEMTNRDLFDKARVEFASKEELNKAMKTIRDLISSTMKMAWALIVIFSGLVGFSINALIQLKLIHL